MRLSNDKDGMILISCSKKGGSAHHGGVMGAGGIGNGFRMVVDGRVQFEKVR